MFERGFLVDLTYMFVSFIRVEDNPELFSVTLRNMKTIGCTKLPWTTNEIHPLHSPYGVGKKELNETLRMFLLLATSKREDKRN